MLLTGPFLRYEYSYEGFFFFQFLTCLDLF